MDDLKDRRLKYSRVVWLPDLYENPLEIYLKQAHQALENTERRTFPYKRMEMQGLDYKIDERIGIFVHVTTYIKGQPASLVPSPCSEIRSAVDTLNPPAKKDYMEGDIFFLSNKDHLIICTSGTHEALAFHYIQNMLQESGFSREARIFSIQKILNANKIGIIRNEGVRKISLNGSLYEASLDNMERKSIKKSLLSSVPKEILSLFEEDDDVNLKSIHEAENVSVRLELSFDKRKKGGSIGQERMRKTAQKIIDDEDSNGITIETFSGKKIRQEEIRISKKVALIPRGNSVDCIDAWGKIREYYLELKGSGMLEQ